MRGQSLRRDRNGKRRRANSAAPSLALWIFGIPHLAHGMRLIHQSLQIVDKAFPAVLGILVVAPEVDCLLGADFLTESAEDAAKLVDLENEGITIPFLVLAGNELDAVRG